MMVLVFMMIVTMMVGYIDSGAVQLDNSNIDGVLENNDLVMLNFYADWCRFSNMLAPIWDQGADKVAAEFPGKKVVMGKVDCDKEGALGTRFHITKYPTIKFAQNGVIAKKEYRGQRSVDSFVDFVREHVKDPVIEFSSLDQLNSLDNGKRHLIGYFSSPEGAEYETFKRVAQSVKEDCNSQVGFGSVVEGQELPSVLFRPSNSKNNEKFTGDMANYDQMLAWANERCSPLVREITFENAEELTEEGLPFLILFHNPEDKDSKVEYSDLVSRELMSEKSSVNFLTADGLKFAHPLHHLGKSKADLPLIAIDSFRHMYLFPKFEDIRVPGKVKSFLQDLYNGKLHREFHYGPDKGEEKSEENTKENSNSEGKDENDTKEKIIDVSDEGEVKDDTAHIPRTDENEEEKEELPKKSKSTDPPESQFKHLGPSKNRYTILRDEF